MLTMRAIRSTSGAARNALRRDAAAISMRGATASTTPMLARAVVATAQQSPLGQVAHASTVREQYTRSFSRQRNLEEDAKPAEAKEPLAVDKIAVIGGGNMADAIITGLLSEKLLPSNKIVVSDPNPRKDGVLLAKRWYGLGANLQ